MKEASKNITILYVEDEQKAREELAQVIEIFCEELYLASNGKEGLELYKKYAPDIVITDISMPLMDGIVMSKEIKKINEETHIIFTTAFGETTFIQEALELQAEGYILKPIDLTLLEKKIRSVIKNIQLQKDKLLAQEAKLISMSDMLSAIAHQWRQPLNVINGILFNLSDAFDHEELTQDYFEEMLELANKNITFMSNTIDDFKDFSKATQRSDFYFDDVISTLNPIILAQLKDNMIEVYFDIEEKIKINGSMSDLSHTILNLVNNARDALVESDVKDGKIIVEAKLDGDMFNIRVKDNARGIPETIQERIFEPYFTTKEEGKGTGLGLYLSKLTLERSFQTTLRLEKSSPKGTTFLISIYHNKQLN